MQTETERDKQRQRQRERDRERERERETETETERETETDRQRETETERERERERRETESEVACARRAAAAGTERGLGGRAGKQDGGWTGRPTNRQTDGCIPGTDGGGEADINARVLLTAPRGLWDPTDDGQGWAASLGPTVCAASGGENCGTSPSRAVKRDVSATAADFRPPFVDSEHHLAAWPGPSSRTAGLS